MSSVKITPAAITIGDLKTLLAPVYAGMAPVASGVIAVPAMYTLPSQKKQQNYGSSR